MQISRTRSTRVTPDRASAIRDRDGTCAAGASVVAFQIPLNGDPVVDVIDDPDSFDDPGCIIYLADECDCGSTSFKFNRCTACGSVAPWAAKLGCGLR